jgi:peptidoglycan/LPS O-acetylase OafA/YrhL
VPTGRVSSERLDGLDVLRAAAALLVIVCHAMARSQWSAGGLGWPIGRLGRNLFLLLSSFLLFLPYARAVYAGRGNAAGPSVGNYALRRALRLLPLYFVAVLTLSAAGFVRQWPGTARNLLYHVLFIHTFDERTIYGLIPPLWFIGVIAQWYVLLPLVGWAWLRLRHRLAVWVAATVVTTFGVHALEWTVPAVPSFAFIAVVRKGLVGALPYLFAGMTAAAVFVRARENGRRTTRELRLARDLRVGLVLPAFLVLLVVLLLLRGQGSSWIAPFAMAAMVVAFARASSGGRALALVRTFGRASYSAFVWHVPVIVALLKLEPLGRIGPGPIKTALLLAAALPLTVAAAFASYSVLEKPFFGLERAPAWRLLKRLAAAYGSAVIASTILFVTTGERTSTQNSTTKTERHADTPRAHDAVRLANPR